MPDGQFAREFFSTLGREDISDMAHLSDTVNGAAIAGRDSGAFLSPMLQGVEAKIGQIRGFGMAVNGENATLFMELIEVQVRHQATAAGAWRR